MVKIDRKKGQKRSLLPKTESGLLQYCNRICGRKREKCLFLRGKPTKPGCVGNDTSVENDTTKAEREEKPGGLEFIVCFFPVAVIY